VSVLFENERQARKARLVLAGTILWWIGWSWCAYDMGRSSGLPPIDGGALRPPSERFALAALFWLIGFLPCAGMLAYSQVYLTRIERLRDEVCLTVLGIFRPQTYRFPPSAFAGGAYYRGKIVARISVDAPWMTLRVRDRLLPFIADLQAEFVNRSAIEALLNRKPDEPESGRRRR
jgi:hypothetical protein